MNCKENCLCYSVCTKFEAYVHNPKLSLPNPSECNFFKDHSKFIESPCKVGDNGDIFWALDAYVKSPYEYFISPYQCLGIKYGYDCIEGDNTIMLLAVGGREYIFGKEAFLTVEEAEQALREREKE
jgi:hypothetical protein